MTNPLLVFLYPTKALLEAGQAPSDFVNDGGDGNFQTRECTFQVSNGFALSIYFHTFQMIDGLTPSVPVLNAFPKIPNRNYDATQGGHWLYRRYNCSNLKHPLRLVEFGRFKIFQQDPATSSASGYVPKLVDKIKQVHLSAQGFLTLRRAERQPNCDERSDGAGPRSERRPINLTRPAQPITRKYPVKPIPHVVSPLSQEAILP